MSMTIVQSPAIGASGGSSTAPWGLSWRRSVWFVTTVVTLGITTDLLVYSMLIPVFPFQLQKLGYGSVSALVGWLLFAYSGGLVASTPPVAFVSERYINRQHPLLAGQLFLIGSQILLMEASRYWVMILARVVQGISSSVIWVVGLALLCDTVPESRVGTQLGIAMSGVTLGFLVGPPVGGALYSAFGYRGPFIFGIIVTFIDFVGRILIIERKDAILFGIAVPTEGDDKRIDTEIGSDGGEPTQPYIPMADISAAGPSSVAPVSTAKANEDKTKADVEEADPGHSPSVPRRISILGVLRLLMQSSRALMALFTTLTYGLAYTMQEPTLSLHLQDVWGLSSSKIGLIYIASVVPALASGPISGWWTDHWGAEWITFLSMVLAIPWIAVIIIDKSLALFIVGFALQSFFIAGIISPVTAELAAVARQHEGLGYAHVYGAFNFFYGLGSTFGPLIGGQIYGHLRRGWTAICLLLVGLVALDAVFTIFYTGDRPLMRRIFTTKPRLQGNAEGTQGDELHV